LFPSLNIEPYIRSYRGETYRRELAPVKWYLRLPDAVRRSLWRRHCTVIAAGFGIACPALSQALL